MITNQVSNDLNEMFINSEQAAAINEECRHTIHANYGAMNFFPLPKLSTHGSESKLMSACHFIDYDYIGMMDFSRT